MKQEKLYLKINIVKYLGEKLVQSQQLIRVDNIKEFWPIIYGQDAKNYFNSLNILIKNGKTTEANPFKMIVGEEVFNYLVSIVNQKIGSKNKLNTNTLNIVQSSEHKVCIIIEKSVNNLNI